MIRYSRLLLSQRLHYLEQRSWSLDHLQSNSGQNFPYLYRNSVHRNHPSWRCFVRSVECFCCCILWSKKEATLPRGNQKEKNSNLKGIEKDLSIKEAALKYRLPKKKYEKRNTYCKVGKTFFGNLEKKTGEVSCNMSYTLLKTMINLDNAESYRQLTIFWLPWFFYFFPTQKQISLNSLISLLFISCV